jgi:hypothetical protein
VGAFLRREFSEYEWRSSAVSVVILDVLRCATLFFTFAYRFHTNATAFGVSAGVVLVSAAYSAVKLGFAQNRHVVPVLAFSLVMSVTEFLVFLAVRRRRITAPDVDAAAVVAAAGGGSAQTRRSLSSSSLSAQYHALPAAGEGELDPEALAEHDSRFLDFDRANVSAPARAAAAAAAAASLC